MTQKQSISITRALVELKRLNNRITTAIQGGKFVSRTVGKANFQKVVGSNETVAEVSNRIQGSFDVVDSLIVNREKIKSAIVMSNATTKVTIMKREMTVAEAIELKGTVGFRTSYLNSLRSQLMQEKLQIEKANAIMEAAIETSLNTVYAGEKSKIDENTLKLISEPQKAQKENALLDPSKIEDRIAKLTEEIADLSSELDFTLSESNSKTVIVV